MESLIHFSDQQYVITIPDLNFQFNHFRFQCLSQQFDVVNIKQVPCKKCVINEKKEKKPVGKFRHRGKTQLSFMFSPKM